MQPAEPMSTNPVSEGVPELKGSGVQGAVPLPPQPAVVAELKGLVAHAKQGDVQALPRIRQILDEHPEVWQRVGDLERIVIRTWAELVGGDNPLSLESIKRQTNQLRADLEGANPTPLERLLVGNVVTCWMEMNHAQLFVAEAGKSTLGQAAHQLKRQESAQKRFLASMKALTTTRALLSRGLIPIHPLRLHDPESKQTGT